MKRKMLIALLVSCGISLAAGIRDGLIFYAPFEDGAEPEIAGGAKTANAGLKEVPGKVGRGALSEGSGVLYNNVGNLNVERGTVAFWVKPEVDFKDLKKSAILFRAVHLALVYQPHGRAFFMTGKVVPDVGFKWDYSLDYNGLRNWKAGSCSEMEKINTTSLRQGSTICRCRRFTILWSTLISRKTNS